MGIGIYRRHWNIQGALEYTLGTGIHNRHWSYHWVLKIKSLKTPQVSSVPKWRQILSLAVLWSESSECLVMDKQTVGQSHDIYTKIHSPAVGRSRCPGRNVRGQGKSEHCRSRPRLLLQSPRASISQLLEMASLYLIVSVRYSQELAWVALRCRAAEGAPQFNCCCFVCFEPPTTWLYLVAFSSAVGKANGS